MSVLFHFAMGVTWPVVVTAGSKLLARVASFWKWYGFPREWLGNAVFQIALFWLWGDHPWAAGAAVSALLAAACWWWKRKGRKAAALLGAKALAFRAALVRTMRERATPRPVLRPAPGGAR